MQVRLNMPVGLAVILVDEEDDRRDMLVSLLSSAGYQVLQALGDADRLKDACAAHRPDAIVVSANQPSRKLLAAIETCKDAYPLPAVLFAEDASARCMRSAVAAGVDAYVVVGLNGNRVRSAIDLALASFEQTESLRSKVIKAEEALRDRKIIERAKGTLMRQRDIDEAEAYTLMRRQAMTRSVRMIDIAKTINDAAEMLMDARP